MRIPPFCPNRGCHYHWQPPRRRRHWWWRAGSYRSARSGVVQRFQCRACQCRFSESTFSIDYFAKRRVDYHRLLGMLVSSSSVRAAARQLHVSRQAVSGRICRLARQALALHASACDSRLSAGEPLVADGFESFWVSHYYPNNLNVLVGASSQFVYALTAATLRRSGRMRAAQKQRRAELERRDRAAPGELAGRFGELLEAAIALWHGSAPAVRRLFTDEHPLYARVLAGLAGPPQLLHLRFSSRLPRTAANPLFAVNYIDREFRKDLAEHRRETVCFARSAVMSLSRMWIYLAYHNYRKPYRVDGGPYESHAVQAGISSRRLARLTRHWLTRRAFLSHTPLSPPMLRVWAGMEHTPLSHDRVNRRVTPRHCFM